jgi:hypothetical protein
MERCPPLFGRTESSNDGARGKFRRLKAAVSIDDDAVVPSGLGGV